MTTKFSAFTAASALADADQLVGLQSGGNVRATMAQVLVYAQSKTKFAADVGDGTNVQIDVTHNLGTRDVVVGVYRNAAPYDEVIPDVQHLSTNAVRLIFSVAPAVAQFRVVVRA